MLWGLRLEQQQQIQRVGNKMEEITINKYYTDANDKIVFIDATLSITEGSVTKSANDIFLVNMSEYNEELAKKLVLSSFPDYKNLRQKIYNMFKLDNLTETVV